METDPSSIMDVGCGFGKYGFLARENLEVRHERYDREDWKVRIDCLEIFPRYITEMHKYIYDNIIMVDIRKYDVKGYDLVILGDIIEHLNKEDAVALIDRLYENNLNILISTPDGFMEQGEFLGNPHEEHLSGWDEEDFDRWNSFTVNIRGILVSHIYKK